MGVPTASELLGKHKTSQTPAIVFEYTPNDPTYSERDIHHAHFMPSLFLRRALAMRPIMQRQPMKISRLPKRFNSTSPPKVESVTSVPNANNSTAASESSEVGIVLTILSAGLLSGVGLYTVMGSLSTSCQVWRSPTRVLSPELCLVCPVV